MRRRRAGALLVVLALVAVVVLAAQGNSRSVPGVATAAPVPPAPTVGDCVLQPFAEGGGWSGPGGIYPPLRTGACTGPRYGEVVTVIADGLTNSAAAAGTAGAPDQEAPDENPLLSTCINSVTAYVGIVSTPGAAPLLFRSWYPPGLPETTVVGPTEQQKAAGQKWVACSYRYPGTQAHQESLKNEFTTGTVPGVFARCRTSVDPTYPTYAPVACNVQHPVEEFGVEVELVSAAQRNASCGQLVHRLTGMADPTDGGRLQIQVLTAPQVADSAEPVYCVLAAVAPHTLDGPLLGVGSSPIPWTN